MQELIMSGINLKDGGTLNIYYDLLDELIAKKVYEKYRITAFVNNTKQFSLYSDKVNLIELSPKNHVERLYYELIFFKKYSKKNKVAIWISMHDITPNVVADKIYTYCQTAFPFMKIKLKYFKYTNMLFILAYKYIYLINKSKASAYIVQQTWMANKLKKNLHINNIIVANPSIPAVGFKSNLNHNSDKKHDFTFIYPSLARFYKNYETVCEACHVLECRNVNDFKIIFTINGNENKYTQMLKTRYGHLKNIAWLGCQPRQNLYEMMKESDCLLYTSELESWGLPIMEYKALEKPIIISNLPYAYEAVGCYERVKFVESDNIFELADAMVQIIQGCIQFDLPKMVTSPFPYAKTWSELIELIL